ncbi:MAG: hypothetical protein CFK52_13680 [Chloracidobacterium sp. CP2_5A]|nr:MAG: hypothetical protein CFK52_13680 [Chloracidobacterium sp. CP2_5A]
MEEIDISMSWEAEGRLTNPRGSVDRATVGILKGLVESGEVSAIRVSASRQSESMYIYAEICEDDDDLGREISIRVSRHRNPAYRWDRLTSSNDRAEPADIEVRLDLRRDWKWAIGEALRLLKDPNYVRPLVG